MLLLTGCASYNLEYQTTSNQDSTPAENTEITYQIFAIGDAGYRSPESEANLALLTKKLAISGEQSSLLFLGDNLYPEGLADEEDTEERKRGEKILEWQIEATRDYPGEIYFIPGNHDWKKGKPGGLKSIRRQDEFISDYDRKDLHFEPDEGCPGPVEIELTDNLTLLIIDSQWWLQNWENNKDINRDCELHTRLDFLSAFDEALKDNKEKQVVVALHHPLYTYGTHGGHFTLKDHIFPLTNVNSSLYIPLPIIGSLYPILRGNFGNVQDVAHPKYFELRESIMKKVELYENVIFLSGHEHNLQYIRQDGQHFLVSGSGSKSTPLTRGKHMHYGNTGLGFMELAFYNDGSVQLVVWDSGNQKPEPSSPGYSEMIISSTDRKTYINESLAEEKIPAVVSTSISSASEKSSLHRFFFGEHYRDLYHMDVRVPTLDLSTALGGLEIVKQGGGFQTNSLRLERKNGHQYVVRSLNKDASRLLPPVFQSTFAMDILQDQFTASHPFAAFAIPGMAEAAGIYSTNPRLVYLPYQNALGHYNETFGDALYLFEERPNGDWSDHESFGYSQEIISTGDVIEATLEKFSNRIDQDFVVRSRLFDMFIGDWDRHDDQWRWATVEGVNPDFNYFRPIPRDRDQAFSNYDGFIVSLANWYTPGLRKMSSFKGDIRRIKWFNFNARYFDRHFLNEVGKGQWIVAAADLQTRLTDEVIEASVRQNWPAEIFSRDGEEIITILKERRDRLIEFSTRYFDELAKYVDIPGTDDADVFRVIWLDEGLVRVRVFDRSSDGDADELYYTRTFLPEETKEIRLYALNGKDLLEVVGNARSRIKVRVIGGPGNDEFITEENRFNGRLSIQDKPSQPDISTALKQYYTEIDSDFNNTYDREAFSYDHVIPVIAIAANPDDGFLIGGGIEYTKYGFQKSPFASKHLLSGQFAFSSSAFKLEYQGKWVRSLGPFNLHAGLLLQGPTYVQNFFGFGNVTDYPDDAFDIDYYRVRIRKYGITPGISKALGRHAELLLEGVFSSTKVEETEGRFITSSESNIEDDVFENQIFAGPQLTFHFKQVDRPVLTRRGLQFNISTGFESDLGLGDTHRWLSSELSLHYQFKYLGKPVLAMRVGVETHGGNYDFFQAAHLGSNTNFRGIRQERFTGDKMFYHNTDLRFVLFKWESYYLPAMFGIVGSFDHGRVWNEGEDSTVWHYAYGGGIWISPFQALIMSLNYHISDVDDCFSFGMGFFF